MPSSSRERPDFKTHMKFGCVLADLQFEEHSLEVGHFFYSLHARHRYFTIAHFHGFCEFCKTSYNPREFNKRKNALKRFHNVKP
jgi:hypothetical protein